MRFGLLLVVLAELSFAVTVCHADTPRFDAKILPLFKARCVKCHGPAKREGKLNLGTPKSAARGGESGPVIVAGDISKSLLWQRVDSDEMPPDEPLSAAEKGILRQWIETGANGLPATLAQDSPGADHWAFQPLAASPPPSPQDVTRVITPVDRFIQVALEERSLSLGSEADRATLIRRVSLGLTGLPPTIDEIEAFVNDRSAEAYPRMVDRYLDSPHYGERWGKFWLDAAGYADSNGYFSADTDRPLAFRYRDYVVRAFNADKPFDQFVREQLAGDELSAFVTGKTATPEIIGLLEATHYLRNGQDGTGESDGNADEVRVDRYTALESAVQIVGSSLLGLTFQCAKCHDHKFEPISQRDYYQLQSVFFPAFNIHQWIKPNDRAVFAHLPGELEQWEQRRSQLELEVAALRKDFAAWVRTHREPGSIQFQDDFDGPQSMLAERWSNQVPGDGATADALTVNVDSEQAPAALGKNGVLHIIESGLPGDRCLSTKQVFDWTPEKPGEWIQVTFDLVDNKVASDGVPAERIAYFIALRDFNDKDSGARGNILIDGVPGGGASVYVDYPGADTNPLGDLGTSGYIPGHNFGVRVTNQGDGKFRLEQLVDLIPEEKTLKLSAKNLPDGGFGFEYCCGRSFIVDNVLIECQLSDAEPGAAAKPRSFLESYKARYKELDDSLKSKIVQMQDKPGKIAWLSDVSEQPPDVFLLERGNYAAPAEKVLPAPLATLADGDEQIVVSVPFAGSQSTGRRLAWANWVTRPNSRAAALLARVQVNRIWQQHFGAGIVATSDNLGYSGSFPSHPELLDWLTSDFVRSGWSFKALHRRLLTSAVYRQSSALQDAAYRVDPDNRLLWRYSLRRLDAESLRDSMLEVSGELDRRIGGAYVPTTRTGVGEVVVPETSPGIARRSVYLYQRRSQVLSLLSVFDTPSMVYNCIQRTPSTIPLQSLSLLNSDFAVNRSRKLAERLSREAGSGAEERIERAFLLAVARKPTVEELAVAVQFVQNQSAEYSGRADAGERAWADFCQALLASSIFLYVE